MSEPKRARQACGTCRKRKARCSGDYPVCALCARLGHTCSWEKASASTTHDSLSPRSRRNNDSLARRRRSSNVSPIEHGDGGVDLAARVAQIEQRLASGGSPWIPLATTLKVSRYTTEGEFSSLPPKRIIDDLVNDFFAQCQNQPYAYFHEASTRQSIVHGTLPEYLLFALLASAVRFSQNAFYRDRTRQAIDGYASAAWAKVSQRTPSDQLDYDMVKAVCLLTAIDATTCLPKAAHLKLALAVQWANELRLYEEPPQHLPLHKQEDRRRTFWSLYFLDRVMALGHHHPPSFVDDDCTVRLPCRDDLFNGDRLDSSTPQPTLEEVLNDLSAPANQDLSYFALAILMASATGQFVRFCLRSLRKHSAVLWDPSSTHATINRILHHFEAVSPCTYTPLAEVLQSRFALPDTGELHLQSMGHFMFAELFYHLNHCLLNHPFVLLQFLQPCPVAIPPSFVQDALRRCRHHAVQLTQKLSKNSYHLSNVVSYGYCAMVAGIIHRIFEHSEDGQVSSHSREMAQESLWYLEQNPARWEIYKKELHVLRSFKPESRVAKTLTNHIGISRKDLVVDGSPGNQLLDYAKIPEMRLLFPLYEDFLAGIQDVGNLQHVLSTFSSGAEQATFSDEWPSPMPDPEESVYVASATMG